MHKKSTKQATKQTTHKTTTTTKNAVLKQKGANDAVMSAAWGVKRRRKSPGIKSIELKDLKLL